MTTPGAAGGVSGTGRAGSIPEVAARLREVLQATPVSGSPSDYARPLYDLLVARGFRREDVLAVSASLMDLVCADVARTPGRG